MIEAKKKLRKQYLALRRSLPPEQVAAWSEQLNDLIIASEVFQHAGVIMGYLAFDGEPNIDRALQTALRQGKQVCVPAFTAQKGIMRAASLQDVADLPVGEFGIRAVPQEAVSVAPATIDLLLTPGLLFTTDGARLGLGGGYYDRFLPAATRAVRLGVLFECFLLPELPLEPHDARVSALVTESRLMTCRQERN